MPNKNNTPIEIDLKRKIKIIVSKKTNANTAIKAQIKMRIAKKCNFKEVN